MELSLSITGVEAGENNQVQLTEKVFAVPFKEPLVHQVVTAYLAGGRAGARAQKSRSEVKGGGKKPWRQKGTGHARAGTIRSPIWRGGGVTFAAKPQNHAQKVNKKMYLAALRAIFSELFRQNRLVLVEKFQLATHKTRDLIKQLKDLDLLEEVLIISEEVDKNLYLAGRNLFKVNIRDVAGIEPVSLIKVKKVLLTVAALRQIEEMLA